MLTQLQQAQNILGEVEERTGRSLERERRELTEQEKGKPQEKGIKPPGIPQEKGEREE